MLAADRLGQLSWILNTPVTTNFSASDWLYKSHIISKISHEIQMTMHKVKDQLSYNFWALSEDQTSHPGLPI
jgi:hypothetical protein